jgi:hypothetical protein
MVSNLSTILVNGINNPDCSFYVGTFVGQLFILKLIMILAVAYWLISFASNLLINPLINKLKIKLWGKK